MQLLLEEWLTTGGDWKSSSLYQKITSRKSERKYGARVWLTKAQLIQKYGSEALAQEIIDSKTADEETRRTQTKAHPDAPESEAGHVHH